MTREELKQVVLAALGQIAPEADPAAISATQPLREQIDLDSMDFLNFVVGLNRRLGVEVPEGDYPQLSTLKGCVEYLAFRQLGGSAAS